MLKLHKEMENLGRANQMTKGRSSRRNVSKRKNDIKVVYISTPMKVKTSASRFREIVQELTGQDSDVVRIMENGADHDTWMIANWKYDHDHDHDHATGLINRDRGSPTTSSNSLFDQDLLRDRTEEGFAGTFDSSLI
ncbi:hypothetical protein Nepgr_006917 [Nepenthes gracilis]|uniref:VQ domain-containing protein n=1 Tax=Nepenthes gracilis TaxID=150966 RepID=A0AAD3S5X3_NEPGR|nr:hypothetical protein Nepgr_006917 [Nepenthes gracilis]